MTGIPLDSPLIKEIKRKWLELSKLLDEEEDKEDED